jgi:hypothetical protein
VTKPQAPGPISTSQLLSLLANTMADRRVALEDDGSGSESSDGFSDDD